MKTTAEAVVFVPAGGYRPGNALLWGMEFSRKPHRGAVASVSRPGLRGPAPRGRCGSGYGVHYSLLSA